jgi:hypothetical protein
MHYKQVKKAKRRSRLKTCWRLNKLDKEIKRLKKEKLIAG